MCDFLHRSLQTRKTQSLGSQATGLKPGLLVSFQFSLNSRELRDTRFHNLTMVFKDVRAHYYCAFLLRTLFIRHARATSTSSARTEQNTFKTKCSADGRCVNLVRDYFCWMHGDPYLFFGRSLPFLIISIITKNKKITIHMGSNCDINTGVRDLEVTLFKVAEHSFRARPC